MSNWKTYKQTRNARYQQAPLEEGGYKYRVVSKIPFTKSKYYKNFRDKQAGIESEKI